jgi:hypothetical protein
MRPTHAIAVALAPLAALPPNAHAAAITAGGTGYAPVAFERDYAAELRNMRSDRADFEIGLGASAAAFDAQQHAAWRRGANQFAIQFDAATRGVSATLNGAAADWTAPGPADLLTLHLVARNGSDTATLALSDLALNGAALDPGAFAPFASASSAPGADAPASLTYLQIAGDGLAAGRWTLEGTITLDWTGRKAPRRGHGRVDVSFGSIAVPAPGAAPLPLVAMLALARRRRTRPARGPRRAAPDRARARTRVPR